ncbi:hypothetical protein DYB37_003635 [Aphanomyces astaci]|uniref:F-box domain-containing protein n=2 Tax=Aphanomyces astaci TaxID=112090 RepID=A0A397DE13_APHAT|nr:hypothetical protein DYB38_000053 [Aphanomyces astaci]RHY96517.1 hypothetical protein DYB35_002746 [Aphanomyces astaci]RHZ10195.1 hypothetical protein DYB37_003635 [Aphanomyces astaci]RHZ16949.1 hypothetical protein DYB26_003232 [Aphanomyces astaci]RLN99161.1 hypothetical protein DYB28_011045 [Aphanomyces astaci]
MSVESFYELPSEVLEVMFEFMDSTSLGHVTTTNHALHRLLQTSSVWKLQVRARFGVIVEAFPVLPSPSWRSIFTNLMCDVSSLAQASPQDILTVVNRPPVYAMDAAAKPVREEILLMAALRRYPAHLSLIQLYVGLLVRPSAPDALIDGVN